MDAHRIRLAVLALAVSSVTLVGCSGAGGGASDGADDGGAVGVTGSEAEASAGAGAEGDVAAEPAPGQRQVIVTAHASVVVDDPASAADAVAALADDAGGRVEGREEYAPVGTDEPGSSTLVLRVPSSALSALLDDLDDLGQVHSISQSEEDVTGTVQDLDARIAALETSTARLLEIMADATDTDDLLAVEAELSERQAQLEALQSQRSGLADQVAMSTLTVTLDATPIAPAEARGGFLGGLEAGWGALVAFLATALVVLGAMLPWVLAIGVPTTLVVVLLRRRRARRPAGPRPPQPPAAAYQHASAP